MNYLLAILFLLLNSGVMEGADPKPVASRLQAKTITGTRTGTVLSNTGRNLLRHEWPVQYQVVTVLSIGQHAASVKSIEVVFQQFELARNSRMPIALLDQPFQGVPIGELLLFPKHFFW